MLAWTTDRWNPLYLKQLCLRGV